MIVVPMDMLARQSDAILWVRNKAGVDTNGIALPYEVVEVLGGKDPPPAGASVLIVPGDFDSVTGVHAPPEPGMHVSPAYRYYPGTASGAEPDGYIIFLRLCEYRGQQVFVCTVQGARAPLEKRAEILKTIRAGGQAPSLPPPGGAATPSILSWWARLLGRGR